MDDGHKYDNSGGAHGRKGNWMQTYTGIQYFPCDPVPYDVRMVDIAWSLSNQCRYTGHCMKYYSVAEHSVIVSKVVEAMGGDIETQLWGLLHDAAEAYLTDVPRPIKPELPQYSVLEEMNMNAITARFGLSREMPEEIRMIDNAMLVMEKTHLMGKPPAPWGLILTEKDTLDEVMTHHPYGYSPKDAYYAFIYRAKGLAIGRMFGEGIWDYYGDRV